MGNCLGKPLNTDEATLSVASILANLDKHQLSKLGDVQIVHHQSLQSYMIAVVGDLLQPSKLLSFILQQPLSFYTQLTQLDNFPVYEYNTTFFPRREGVLLKNKILEVWKVRTIDFHSTVDGLLTPKCHILCLHESLGIPIILARKIYQQTHYNDRKIREQAELQRLLRLQQELVD